MDRLHILIIDDHLLFAEGLKIQLQDVAKDVVVDVITSAAEAIHRLERKNNYDLIIVDINMPEMSGFEVLSIFQAKAITTCVLVVSASNDRLSAERAFSAGALGYLSKNSSPQEMCDAVIAVARGDKYIDPSIPRIQEIDDSASLGHSIPPRTVEVLNLMARGHSNKVIANLLDISEATVKWHISRLFEILVVKNRTACVNKALSAGLINAS
jgi:DNA-binding NarL/FixJ family response regulator